MPRPQWWVEPRRRGVNLLSPVFCPKTAQVAWSNGVPRDPPFLNAAPPDAESRGARRSACAYWRSALMYRCFAGCRRIRRFGHRFGGHSFFDIGRPPRIPPPPRARLARGEKAADLWVRSDMKEQRETCAERFRAARGAARSCRHEVG